MNLPLPLITENPPHSIAPSKPPARMGHKGIWRSLSNIFSKPNPDEKFDGETNRTPKKRSYAKIWNKLFKSGSRSKLPLKLQKAADTTKPLSNISASPKGYKAELSSWSNESKNKGFAMAVKLPPGSPKSMLDIVVEIEAIANEDLSERSGYDASQCTDCLEETESKTVFSGRLNCLSDTDVGKLENMPLYLVDSSDNFILYPGYKVGVNFKNCLKNGIKSTSMKGLSITKCGIGHSVGNKRSTNNPRIISSASENTINSTLPTAKEMCQERQHSLPSAGCKSKILPQRSPENGLCHRNASTQYVESVIKTNGLRSIHRCLSLQSNQLVQSVRKKIGRRLQFNGYFGKGLIRKRAALPFTPLNSKHPLATLKEMCTLSKIHGLIFEDLIRYNVKSSEGAFTRNGLEETHFYGLKRTPKHLKLSRRGRNVSFANIFKIYCDSKRSENFMHGKVLTTCSAVANLNEVYLKLPRINMESSLNFLASAELCKPLKLKTIFNSDVYSSADLVPETRVCLYNGTSAGRLRPTKCHGMFNREETGLRINFKNISLLINNSNDFERASYMKDSRVLAETRNYHQPLVELQKCFFHQFGANEVTFCNNSPNIQLITLYLDDDVWQNLNPSSQTDICTTRKTVTLVSINGKICDCYNTLTEISNLLCSVGKSSSEVCSPNVFDVRLKLKSCKEVTVMYIRHLSCGEGKFQPELCQNAMKCLEDCYKLFTRLLDEMYSYRTETGFSYLKPKIPFEDCTRTNKPLAPISSTNIHNNFPYTPKNLDCITRSLRKHVIWMVQDSTTSEDEQPEIPSTSNNIPQLEKSSKAYNLCNRTPSRVPPLVQKSAKGFDLTQKPVDEMCSDSHINKQMVRPCSFSILEQAMFGTTDEEEVILQMSGAATSGGLTTPTDSETDGGELPAVQQISSKLYVHRYVNSDSSSSEEEYMGSSGVGLKRYSSRNIVADKPKTSAFFSHVQKKLKKSEEQIQRRERLVSISSLEVSGGSTDYESESEDQARCLQPKSRYRSIQELNTDEEIDDIEKNVADNERLVAPRKSSSVTSTSSPFDVNSTQ